MAGSAKRPRADINLSREALGCLIVPGLCFAAGAVSGLLFAALRTPDSALADTLRACLAQTADGQRQPLLRAVWDQLRWPLIACVLSLTALGAAGIPVLLFLRGFLLCFTAGSFASLLGVDGLWAAWALLGVSALLGLPALFAVACPGFRAAVGRLRGGERPSAASRAVPVAGAFLTTVLAILLQRLVSPGLVSVIWARYF